jgi:hypothetical protein
VTDHSQLSAHFSTFTLISSELLSTVGGLMGCPDFLLTTSAILAILNPVKGKGNATECCGQVVTASLNSKGPWFKFCLGD